MPVAQRTGRSRRWRGAGVGASAAFHLLVLLLLGLALRHEPLLGGGPVIKVSLLRLRQQPAAEARPHPPPQSRSPQAGAVPERATTAPIIPTPPAVALPAPEGQPTPQALSRGLRATVGCAHPDDYHLTPAERAACAGEMARDRPLAPDYGPGDWYPNARARAAHDAALQRAIEAAADARLHPKQEPLSEDCPWLRCTIGR